MKYGVIGTGHMGQYHVNVLVSMRDIELAGVYDQDTKKAAQVAAKYGLKSYKKLEDLLEVCEAVSVAVPTPLHYELGKKLLLAGKHILMEKPVTEKVEEAEELMGIAREKKLILQVGHVERFNGAVQELSKVVEKPLLWESRRLGPGSGRITDVGVIMDLMIHDIDICLQVIRDDVLEISAFGTSLDGKHEDAATAILRFKNGCVANLSTSRITQEKIRTLSISQPDSYLYLDFTTQDLQIHRQASSAITTSSDKISYKQMALIERLFIHKENPLLSEIRHFIKTINNKDMEASLNQLDLKTLQIAASIRDQVAASL